MNPTYLSATEKEAMNCKERRVAGNHQKDTPKYSLEHGAGQWPWNIGESHSILYLCSHELYTTNPSGSFDFTWVSVSFSCKNTAEKPLKSQPCMFTTITYSQMYRAAHRWLIQLGSAGQFCCLWLGWAKLGWAGLGWSKLGLAQTSYIWLVTHSSSRTSSSLGIFFSWPMQRLKSAGRYTYLLLTKLRAGVSSMGQSKSQGQIQI